MWQCWVLRLINTYNAFDGGREPVWSVESFLPRAGLELRGPIIDVGILLASWALGARVQPPVLHSPDMLPRCYREAGPYMWHASKQSK
jgi:hypothetical protein